MGFTHTTETTEDHRKGKEEFKNTTESRLIGALTVESGNNVDDRYCSTGKRSIGEHNNFEWNNESNQKGESTINGKASIDIGNKATILKDLPKSYGQGLPNGEFYAKTKTGETLALKLVDGQAIKGKLQLYDDDNFSLIEMKGKRFYLITKEVNGQEVTGKYEVQKN